MVASEWPSPRIGVGDAAATALWIHNGHGSRIGLAGTWRSKARVFRSCRRYGSKLVRRSVAGHLGGTIDYQWSPEGIIVTLKLTGEILNS